MSRKGNSGLSTGSNGTSVTQVDLPNGSSVDLGNNPLVYGDKDPNLTGVLREKVEAQEDKRRKAKIEYAMGFDKDGNALGQGEYKGGKNSVASPWYVHEGEVFTHNHPRGTGEEGVLGGTFSDGDLVNFANHKAKIYRASAGEGTYSISKGANFDASGFTKYQINVSNTAMDNHKQRRADIKSQWQAGKISVAEGKKLAVQSFNTMLVEVHNQLLAGQSTYGYTYTLEAT